MASRGVTGEFDHSPTAHCVMFLITLNDYSKLMPTTNTNSFGEVWVNSKTETVTFQMSNLFLVTNSLLCFPIMCMVVHFKLFFISGKHS